MPLVDERYLADALDNIPIVKGDKVTVPFFGGRLTFEVIAVTPASVPTLSKKGTVFHITESEVVRGGIAHVTYEDIGGLKDEIQKVREMIELPLRHPEIFEKLASRLQKAYCCTALLEQARRCLPRWWPMRPMRTLSISGPEIMSRFYGESEARLREIFKEAKDKRLLSSFSMR